MIVYAVETLCENFSYDSPLKKKKKKEGRSGGRLTGTNGMYSSVKRLDRSDIADKYQCTSKETYLAARLA